uniref:Uncharacterized protein n=1 Tax=Strongyloides venezuelensis TaxID=75913 RepID=A0A0K0FQU7_STRVS
MTKLYIFSYSPLFYYFCNLRNLKEISFNKKFLLRYILFTTILILFKLITSNITFIIIKHYSLSYYVGRKKKTK